MNDRHVGEDAELYAIGSLNDDERARVDAHLTSCATCRARVGEAEETILALERLAPASAITPPPPSFARNAAPRWWIAAAVAAALVIGFLLPHPQPSETAQLAMLHSHFNHAQFSGSGPLAKVLYDRDRSWYYVVVEGSHAYTVVGATAESEATLGTTTAKGATSELFVRGDGRFARIELRDGTRTIETAQIR